MKTNPILKGGSSFEELIEALMGEPTPQMPRWAKPIEGGDFVKGSGGRENGPDDGYGRVIDLMNEAVIGARREGIGLLDFLPALVDFTTTVALIINGEICVEAFVDRMHSRVDDWRNGTFLSGLKPHLGQDSGQSRRKGSTRDE